MLTNLGSLLPQAPPHPSAQPHSPAEVLDVSGPKTAVWGFLYKGLG